MKNEQLHTWLCATGISFCLGLGAVGSMATGLDLPVKLAPLAILCAILAAVIAGLTCLRRGSLICLGFGSILLLNPDFWTELKTLGAAVAMRLRLGYGIPTPTFLEGELSEQVLSALCLIGGLIMVAAAWAVQKRKTALPAAVLSLLPLGCCITVQDTVPQALFLFLWGLALVLLMMTQGARRESALRGNRLTAWLVLPTVLVLLLIFRLVPQDAPDRWSIGQLPEKILSHFTGPGPSIPGRPLPSQVNLSALEKRQQRQTPAMEVTAGFTGPLYLRSRSYDQYTGTGWHATPGYTEELYGFEPQFHQKDGTVKIAVRQPQSFYYLPFVTQQSQLLTGGLLENPTLETSYEFDHCSLREDWQNVWVEPPASTVHPRYLALPDTTYQGAWAYQSEQGNLLSGLASNFSSPAMAEQIRLHLQDHVPYNLNTPNMPEWETDLALWFLKDAQTGYCVHFATAAVVLLRANGIPARYVEGYAVHVEKGETTTVRELHAHAWAEYYVNGVGWLVLDATPGGDTSEEEPETTQPTETQPVTTTAPTKPTAPSTDPEETEQNPVKPQKEPVAWLKPVMVTLIWTTAALLLLWGQYRLRRSLFRRSVFKGSPNRRALKIHKRLCQLSKWTKDPVPPELLRLAQKARFSPYALTKPELSQLQGHLKLAESAVSLLPLPKRLFAKWLFARY